MLKHKRVIAIAIAILFLVALFLVKNNEGGGNQIKNSSGLNYTGEETLQELIVKDANATPMAMEKATRKRRQNLNRN